MKKNIKYLFLSILLLASAGAAHANHVFGADLYYEYVSGITYKVTLALYGDCNAASDPTSPFNNLPTAVPQIQLLDSMDNVLQVVSLNLEGPGEDVTPVCPREKLNTKCNGGTIDGIKRFIYSGLVNVNLISSGLKFRFTGQMGNTSAGRSNQITNLASPGNSIMTMDAELNNRLGPNSSPQFTTTPTPFYCVNVAQQYNMGAVDANNDSLGFSLEPAMEPGGVAATYAPGFSPTQPLATAPGAFTFNPVNGQFTFTPSNSNKYLIVNKTTEYRNGIKVGSATREMTFLIQANCTANVPPTGAPDTTSGHGAGGVMTAGNNFNVCEGASLIKFDIVPSDADGDTIQVSLNGLPTGANATITGNNTTHPRVSFSWNTSAVAVGTYNFFVSYKDNGCPVSSQQTQAYTINVVKPNELTSKLLFPTECAHKAKVQYNLSYGLVPRIVTVSQGGVVLHTLTDTSSVMIDSLAAGTWDLTVTSRDLLCASHYTITVKDSGTYPYPPTFPDVFYCLNDQAVALTATPATNGNIFWYDSLGTRLTHAPIPSTAMAGIFRYMASQQVKVCESRQDTALVYVTKRPTADFTIDPSPICARDTATIAFTGSIGVGPILEYKWNWGSINPVSGDSAGPYRVVWNAPGIQTIRLQVFENKCPSDSIEKQVRVKPRPVAAFTLPSILCQYDSATIRYATPDSLAGQQYTWDFGGATLASSGVKGPFRIHWNTAGQKTIRLGVVLEGCIDTVSHTTQVQDAPVAQILNVPEAVCTGDKILLKYITTGTDNTYAWYPKDQIRYEADGAPSTRVYTAPATYTLVVTNQYACVDTATITYDKVSPCCQFSYPNAFTPNGDGKNDRFRVVTYGNDDYFDLSIFNRWGQRVYHSSEPKDGWDGTFNGRACDAGIYYYMLRAKCITGHEEDQHGELTLVR